ncbi:hypothetical protein [Kaistella palustris]|uniref:hypothetical protein n=1 Tax=Kaistella palustris TaxID=493376 RepID=UPI0004049CCC|nr:hypothetical protein [Kaistella palustris]
MDAFQEFDQPQGPERSTGAIISHAFETYKGVFLYGLAAMVLYLLISLVIQSVSGFNAETLSEEIRTADGDFSMMSIWGIPGMGTYYGLSGLVGLLFSPVYVGLIYMANKYNSRETIHINDLFIGYRQNTLNIIIYSLFSGIIMVIAFSLCFLPGVFVLPLLLLGYPVLLFENATFSEALSKSFNIAKENYGVFLGASVLGWLISAAGIILCGIGLLATIPFYLIVMYSTYCAFLGKPRIIATPN